MPVRLACALFARETCADSPLLVGSSPSACARIMVGHLFESYSKRHSHASITMLRKLVMRRAAGCSDGTLSVKTVSPPHALSRRGLLDTAAAGPATIATIALPALAEVEQLAAPGKSVGAMQKLKSGVRYIDLKEGSGAGVSSRLACRCSGSSGGRTATSLHHRLDKSAPGRRHPQAERHVGERPVPIHGRLGAALPGLDEARCSA